MDTIKSRKKIGFPKKSEWLEYPTKITKNSLVIAGHSIMEKWETNYMEMLAGIATKNRGDILEIGYGLGIASNFIQKKNKIKSHTIIEFHPDIIKSCMKKYSRQIKNKKIKILEGFWEEITPKLKNKTFDGILFDTYPLTEKQLHKNHFWFFREAHRLLKDKGVFTYYSDEHRNFSKEHLKKLSGAGFKNITFKICKVNPPKKCMYWNKKTLLAPIIIK